MNLMFVYGTLKLGGSNHAWLAGQQSVGPARTVAGYTLYQLDGYPGMVRCDDDFDWVCGEVWAVDSECLANLDRLEGTAEGLYRRELVPLWGPFAAQKVEAYLYLLEVAGHRWLGSEWIG